MTSKPCEVCGKEISPRAAFCPSCGDPQKISSAGSALGFMARLSPAIMPIILAMVGGAFTWFQFWKDREWLEQEAEKAEATAKADRAVQLLQYLVSEKDGEKSLSVFLSLTFASQNQLSDGVIPILARASEEDPKLKQDLKHALLRLRLEEDKRLEKINRNGETTSTKLGDQIDLAIASLFEKESVHFWRQRKIASGSPADRRAAFQQLLISLPKIGTTVEKERLKGALEETMRMINLLDSTESIRQQRDDPLSEDKSTLLTALGEELERITKRPAENSFAKSDVLDVIRPLVSEMELRVIFEGAAIQFDRLAIVHSGDSQHALAREVAIELMNIAPVPHYENIDGKTIHGKRIQLPDSVKIRYHDSNTGGDADLKRRKMAQAAQAILHSKFKVEAELQPLPSAHISERELEVWLSDPEVSRR